MTFELPSLDVMDARRVLEQLVRRIPEYAPRWTDHNASDPGITLLQMLVWICEGTAYTANAVPLETYRNMLRWVAGLSSAISLPGSDNYGTEFPYAIYADTNVQDPAYEALKNTLGQVEMGSPLGYAALQEAVAAYRRAPFLAITPNDLSALALELNAFIDAQAGPDPTPPPLHVARSCLKQNGDVTELFLVNDAAYAYTTPADVDSGTFSIALTSPLDDPASPPEVALLDAVRQYFAARTLLGGAVAIRLAQLCYLEVTCQVLCFARERADEVAGAVLAVLQQALQPVRQDGGRNWAYGAKIDASALMPVIASVPGVDRVEYLTVDAFHPRPPVVLLRRPHPSEPAERESLEGSEAVHPHIIPHRLPVIDTGLPRLYSASVTALEAGNG